MSARRVKKPKVAATAQALDQLVSQFAQPLAFLRELVQNSLDAATELIEVDVDHDDDAGCCFVRVRDTGIGMDRNIIDTKLTRLFASSKEDDLTKIGKFGIGFVSIFAIKPNLVVLETGRDGESWRILFKPDRSFELRQLQAPVEGTVVTVFIPGKKSELAQLQSDCRETVAFWCRHSEVEIQFNGEAINEPFELPEATFSYHHRVEGTEAVVAPSLDIQGFHGYYNRGLTLLEGKGSPLPHVSFKLRSRYLEHTLSRDNIIFDEQYERAMAEVRLAAYTDMPVRLLEQLVRQESPELWDLALVLAKYPPPARQAFEAVAIFPSSGGKLSLSQLSDEEEIYFHPQVDDYWRAVEASGVKIVLGQRSDSVVVVLLRDLGCQISRLSDSFLQFRLVVGPPDSPQVALLEALKTADPDLKRLVLVEALQLPRTWSERFCGYLYPDLGVAKHPYPRPPLRPEQSIGVFVEHPFWGKLLALHSVQPELAVSLGSRKISLELGLGTRGDSALFGRLVKSLRARDVEGQPT